ncbi:hypothetical protein, partial [Eggerthella sinensis]|uniref:hypothetical protein n=1 Tax=Eggerthella sinensis TaxID=242230 RepID=UPI0022E6B79A
MDPRELDKDRSTIADIVTAEKVDAVNSGIVKDDEAQSLSTLASREDALGTRRPKEGAKGNPRKARAAASASAGNKPASAQGPSEGTPHVADETNGRLKVRQVLERQAVSELDDTDEFEGAQAHTTPGRAQSAASQQHGSARRRELCAHPRAARAQGPRRARAPVPQERAQGPRRARAPVPQERARHPLR